MHTEWPLREYIGPLCPNHKEINKLIYISLENRIKIKTVLVQDLFYRKSVLFTTTNKTISQSRMINHRMASIKRDKFVLFSLY